MSSSFVVVNDAALSGSSPQRCGSYEASAAKLSWLPEAMEAVGSEVREFQRLAELLGNVSPQEAESAPIIEEGDEENDDAAMFF